MDIRIFFFAPIFLKFSLTLLEAEELGLDRCPIGFGEGASEGERTGCNDGSMDRTGNLKNVAHFYFLLLEITIYSVVGRYREMRLFRSVGLSRSYTNFVNCNCSKNKNYKIKSPLTLMYKLITFKLSFRSIFRLLFLFMASN